jgi:hypothetical protein
MNEKKIPTIVGILLVLGIVGGLFLVKNGTAFFSRASKEVFPQEVKITNITDSSFTVSWVTQKEAIGYVEVEETSPKTHLDNRDATDNLGKYTTHYVEVKNLDSEKKYSFTIYSEGKEFRNEGRSYSVTTAGLVSGEPEKANLASGKIVTSTDEPANGSIVYVDISQISPLSALVTEKGNWVIPLARAYSEDLIGRANYVEGEIKEIINVDGGEMGNASAVVYTNNDDPVPLIKLGGDYDFTTNADNAVFENEEIVQPGVGGSRLQTPENVEVEKGFKIISPNDGETINTSRPQIFGEGPQGGRLKINLESPVEYEAELEIGPDNQWQWVPPEDLTPGPHTLKVNYIDPQTGEEESFLRTFVLAASVDDSEPAYSASPSGSTATPTMTPSPTSQPTNTPEPTETPLPTKTTAPTSPPRKSQPSTESGVPDSGFWEPTFILLGGSLFVILGFLWL